MPRLELSVRNASALAANFAGLSGRAKARARRVVRGRLTMAGRLSTGSGRPPAAAEPGEG